MSPPARDSVGALLEGALTRYGDRLALVAGTERRTYRQLAEQGARLANALAGMGLAPGDPVAAMLGDRLEAVECYVACAAGGYVLVPVNARLAAPEVAHILDDAQPRALLYAAPFAPVVETAGAGALAVSLEVGPATPGLGSARRYEDALGAASARWPTTAVGADEMAVVAYTSGTTGRPKGALCSQRAVVTCARLVPAAHGMAQYGTGSFPASLSFVSAVWGVVLPHLVTGSSLRLAAGLDVESWFFTLEADRATYTWLPTPWVDEVCDLLEARPDVLETLQTVVHTGAGMRRASMERLVDLIGDRLLECWGMTESVGPLTATTRPDLRPGCLADDVLASVGRPVATAEVAVVDAGGRILAPGDPTTGELVARADTLFSGYLNQPEATARVLADGRYRTGDAGRVDAAGYVYVTGRVDDLINSGGMNVYPLEVEAALAAVPGVAEAAVFALPHDRFGQTVAAAVVRAPGARLEAGELLEALAGHLASYKKPTVVHFVDELPKNASMKVQKYLLVERFGNPGTTRTM